MWTTLLLFAIGIFFGFVATKMFFKPKVVEKEVVKWKVKEVPVEKIVEKEVYPDDYDKYLEYKQSLENVKTIVSDEIYAELEAKIKELIERYEHSGEPTKPATKSSAKKSSSSSKKK